MLRTLIGLTALTAAAASAQTDVATKAAGAPVAGKQRSIADFAQLPLVESPEISPNGKLLAAKIAISGKQYFAIMPLDGTPPRLIGLGDVDLDWWRWVNDDWLVTGVGDTQSVAGDDWYISRALGIPVDKTRKIVPLARDAAQDAADVIWIANDGSPRVLLSYQTSIFSNDPGFWRTVTEFDVSTGKGRRVTVPQVGVMDWYADGNGKVRMGIGHSDDGRSTRVLYRPPSGGVFRVIDRAKTHVDSLIVPVLFHPDGTNALMIDDDDDGLSALYELDLATLKRGKQVFASKGYDISNVVADETGFKLLGVAVNEESRTTRWLDPDVAAVEQEAGKMVKNGTVRILSLSRDHSRAIVRAGAPDSAGLLLLFDRKAGTMTQIGYGNEAFKARKLHPVKTIRYKARDGLEIPAVLTLPAGKKSNLPLIVMPHGGPFARDTEEWDWWTQFLADRGYAVIQPNYRGSSGYGTPFTKKGEGQWGLAMQDDLNDAVTELAKQGIADPKRVCMIGASYGGYAAERAAQRDGALYRCAVSYAGVSDLNAMIRYDSKFLMAGVRKDWLRKQAPDLKAVSPINFPQQFSIPLLVIHGAKDTVVQVKQSRQLVNKLRSAGKQVEYLEQPLGDHHFSRAEDRQTFLEAMEKFLAKYNPA